MKRIIGLLLILTMLLTACGQADPAQEDGTERICVGISVGENGYYLMCADVEMVYYKGELTNIEISDPTLLAFQVSENWNGGAYIYSYEEISKIIDVLKQYDDPALEALIEALQHGLLMTQAST